MMRIDDITETERQPRRLRFRVDDYYKMIDLGMIENYEKAEIIDGELVQKMTIGDRHALVVDLLNRFFARNLSDDIRVRVQNPLRLTEYDEPQPDVVLTDLTKYDGRRHPTPAETLIVIEVSDKPLKYDRETKLPLYAGAAIPEVWIVNLPNNVVEVHQQPTLGIYQLTKIFKRGETVESSVLPDLKLEVDAILK
jgi:Uma2 family endonuclease